MREVGEVAAQRQRRERVDRLGDEETARPKLRRRKLQQPDERRRRQVLDDLSGEDPPERPGIESLEVRHGIRLLDVELLTRRVRDHVRVGVDPAGLDARLAQQRQELAAAAADVEHRSGVSEVVDVRTLPIANRGRGPAHPGLERKVVRKGRSGRLGRNRRHQGGCRPRAAPLDAPQTLLELRQRAAARFVSCPGAVGSLVEVVDELQHGVVERALLRRQRLDIPPEQRPQEPLDGIRDRALDARSALQGTLGRDGPHPLSLCAPRCTCTLRTGPTTADLLAQMLEQRDGVHLRGRRSLCRRTIVPAAVRHGRMVLPACYGTVSSGTLARCASGSAC